MQHTDRKQFITIIEETAEVFGVDLSQAVVKLHWAAYADLSLEQVQHAFGKWIMTGQRFPVPAQIRELCAIADPAGHPDAEIAWAKVAALAGDGRDTHIISEPMREAWAVAGALIVAGDLVAARMAFLPAYRQAVASSAGRPRWHVIQGDDRQLREQRVMAAIQDGRLPPTVAPTFALPAPATTTIAGLIESAATMAAANTPNFPSERDSDAQTQERGDSVSDASARARAGLQRVLDAIQKSEERDSERAREAQERKLADEAHRQDELARLRELERSLIAARRITPGGGRRVDA